MTDLLSTIIFDLVLSIPLAFVEIPTNDTVTNIATQAPAGQVSEDTVRVQERAIELPNSPL